MSYSGLKTDPNCAALNRAQTIFSPPATGDGYAHALILDSNGLAILSWGNDVPTDASAGFSPGGLFIHYDGAAGLTLYVNDGGSGTSCSFKAVATSTTLASYLLLAGGTLTDGANLALGTTTGTQIGTAAAQKVALHGATPTVQQDHLPDLSTSGDMTGSDSVSQSALETRLNAIATKVNSVIAVLEAKGFTATS